MKKIIFILFICMAHRHGYAQTVKENQTVSIIPQPVSLSIQKGTFIFNPESATISADKEAADVASFFSELIRNGYAPKSKGGKVLRSSANTKANIELRINKDANSSIGDEGYTLKVTPQKIMLSANKPKGLFYGIQTLMQLFPPSNSNEQTKRESYNIPCVEITDYPRFGYRGMMLDVSRHFFTKDFIKKYIDEMAKYKFNVFH